MATAAQVGPAAGRVSPRVVEDAVDTVCSCSCLTIFLVLYTAVWACLTLWATKSSGGLAASAACIKPIVRSKMLNNCVRKVRCRWGFIFCGEVGNICNELLALAAKLWVRCCDRRS